jgi:hypothetical protein
MTYPTPLANKVLVSVNLHQKDDAEIELIPGVKIWINHDFGVDGKVTQPSLAVVRKVGSNVAGIYGNDVILCHHNTFRSIVANGYRLGDLGMKDENGLDIFSIPPSFIHLKLDAEGNPYPLSGYFLVERVPYEVATDLVVPDSAKKNYKNKFKVLEVYEGSATVKKGDMIITHVMSDYEIHYNWKSKDRVAIRVKEDDVLAIGDY